jgi:FkbM family methyltransferase
MAAALNYLKWQFLLRVASLFNTWSVVEHDTGLRIVVKKGQHGMTGNLYLGLLEFEEMLFVIHCLKSSDIFFDIGANAGIYTLLAAGLCKARAYSFEPVPSTYYFLQANVALNNLGNRVSCFNCGVGDKDEKLCFEADKDAMNKVVDGKYDGSTIEADTIQLDSMFSSVNGDFIMLKIDTEGYELNVLGGATRLLESPRTKVVLIEMNQADAINEMMTRLGFMSFTYDPSLRKLRQASHRSRANIIYIRDVACIEDRLIHAEPFMIRNRRY